MNIFEAKTELNSLLKNHPELIDLQKQIEEKLNSAGNSHNRMVILSQMMSDNLDKLMKALQNLQKLSKS